MAAACGLDRLIGDPRWSLHPVQVMGVAIAALRRWVEAIAGDRPWALRCGGGVITVLLVGGSGLAGWGLEQLSRAQAWAAPLLVLGLASALAGRSLRQAVEHVLQPLAATPPQLELARERLAWIVGRDVAGLPAPELLRAAAETASENAVDGFFAPLFWMLLGALLCSINPALPGPLALALSLVTLASALRDGASDPSPNAGVSQAAYAHAVGVQLGGVNHYQGEERTKPLLNAGAPAVSMAATEAMLKATQRVALLWLLSTGLMALMARWMLLQ